MAADESESRHAGDTPGLGPSQLGLLPLLAYVAQVRAEGLDARSDEALSWRVAVTDVGLGTLGSGAGIADESGEQDQTLFRRLRMNSDVVRKSACRSCNGMESSQRLDQHHQM